MPTSPSTASRSSPCNDPPRRSRPASPARIPRPASPFHSAPRTRSRSGQLSPHAISLRVPTPTVSVVDFTAEIEKETTTEELRQAFRDAAKTPRFKGILEAVDEPLVSMDFKGSPYSSSVDLPFTSVLGKEKSTFIKVVTWYDNEWGYSVRTADLAALMAKSL